MTYCFVVEELFRKHVDSVINESKKKQKELFGEREIGKEVEKHCAVFDTNAAVLALTAISTCY